MVSIMNCSILPVSNCAYTRVSRVSQVQLPNLKIENSRKANPSRQRHDAAGREFIELIKSRDGRENEQNLRYDVDQA